MSRGVKRDSDNSLGIMKYIVISVIVVLIAAVGWKFYVFFNDYVLFETSSIKIKDVIEIDRVDNSCNVSDGYINLYIPEGFRKNESRNVSWYDLSYSITGERDAAIAFMEPDKTFEENIVADEAALKRLERNNIENGYDLIRYYYDNQNKSINIFSSTNRIKMNRLASLHMEAIATSDEVYLIEGDLEGILCVGEKIYHAVLFYNDYYYIVDFYNENVEYFNYDKVVEYLSFITFEI